MLGVHLYKFPSFKRPSPSLVGSALDWYNLPSKLNFYKFFMNFQLMTLFKKIGFIWFLWGISIVLNIITLLFVQFKIGTEGNAIALKYNVIAGVEWYGAGFNLYLIPLVAFLITAVNFILFKMISNKKEFLNFLTVFTTLSVQLILLLAVVLISKVN